MNTLPQITHQLDILTRASGFNAYYTLPHVGDYKFSARTSDFHGWIKCDGRSLNMSDYPALYEVIGTSFGGGCEGTFNVPNISGRVPAAIGTSTDSNHPLGEAIGAETHILIIDEMPTHNHGVTDPGHSHSGDDTVTGVQGTDNAFNSESAADNQFTSGSVNSNVTNISINDNGSSQPHNNMQPTIYIGSMFIFGGTRFVGADPVPMPED
jgi:microcystin-dependent protein